VLHGARTSILVFNAPVAQDAALLGGDDLAVGMTAGAALAGARV
jgi:hypothetical protein